MEKRIKPLAASINSPFVEECDVTSDAAIDQVFEKAAAQFGTIDFLVHSITFAPREEYVDGGYNIMGAQEPAAMGEKKE